MPMTGYPVSSACAGLTGGQAAAQDRRSVHGGRSYDGCSAVRRRKKPEGRISEGDWHDFWTGMPIKSATDISVPSSTDKIPVYVKSGSLVPWADVGQFARTPETRQLSARVYGDGSIPFSLRTSAGSGTLTWKHRKGKAEGQGADYNANSWDVIG